VFVFLAKVGVSRIEKINRGIVSIAVHLDPLGSLFVSLYDVDRDENIDARIRATSAYRILPHAERQLWCASSTRPKRRHRTATKV
jgi:hypothetical protein